jgi:uncharacterized protein
LQNDSGPKQAAMPSGWKKRLRRFALTVLPILAGLHFYIGWSLLPAMPISHVGKLVAVFVLVVSTLLVPLGMMARFVVLNPKLADKVAWVGTLNMGLFSSVLVLTLMRELLLALTNEPSLVGATAMAVPMLATLITAIGFFNARRVAKIVRVDIPLAGLPAQLDGFTIVQISDIHVGPTIKGAYVAAIVKRVNSLNADLVAITGDVVDGSVQRISMHTAPLAQLKARHGVYVVTGNHEYYSGAIEWMAEFERLGMHGLLNEHVVIEHEGARLIVAGITDYTAHLFDEAQRSDPVAALSGAPQGIPKILLAHQPRSATAAEAAGFDLQLSGHTHGGQFWPWSLFVRFQQPFTAGLHRLGKLWVYTSRGTGYWGPPKRFGAPSEITVIRLRCS